MIRLFLTTIKLCMLAVIVLVIGQIPIEKKRIFDHVADFTRSEPVQKPIQWVSQKVDFTNGYKGSFHEERIDWSKAKKKVTSAISQQKPGDRPVSTNEHSRSDSDQLSGILKH